MKNKDLQIAQCKTQSDKFVIKITYWIGYNFSLSGTLLQATKFRHEKENDSHG